MIDELWGALISASAFPVHRRVSTDHPLDLFAQLDDSGRVGLLAISDAGPSAAPTYSAVEVVVGRRGDGKWATSLSLVQPQLKPMFAAMCSEIVEQGKACAEGADPAAFVLQHLSRWNRLLALGPDGLLSIEERLGLLGELSLLLLAIDRFGADNAVDGWRGPHDAPQDFLLPCGYVEVKSIYRGGPEVRISSLEQLDISEAALTLAVYEFSPCPTGTGGRSLAGVVSNVRAVLVGSAYAAPNFEASLRAGGYMDKPEYEVDEFRVAKLRWFLVSDEFPRLCRSEVASAISAAKYRLRLAALERFETNRVF
jgi:Putative  PD-(D/E)XK family member, (DUF4420)